MIAGARTFFDPNNLVDRSFYGDTSLERPGSEEMSPVSSDGTSGGSFYGRISAWSFSNGPFYFQRGPFRPAAAYEANHKASHKALKAIMPIIRGDSSLQPLVTLLRRRVFFSEEDAKRIERVGILASHNLGAAYGLLKLAVQVFSQEVATQLPYNFEILLYFASADFAPARAKQIPSMTIGEHNFFYALARLLPYGGEPQRLALDAFMAASYADISDETSFGRAFMALGLNPTDSGKQRVADMVLKVSVSGLSTDEIKKYVLLLADEYLWDKIPERHRTDLANLIVEFGNYFTEPRELSDPHDIIRHRTVMDQFVEVARLAERDLDINWAGIDVGLSVLSRDLEKLERASRRRSAPGPAPYYRFPGAQFASVDGDISTLPAFRAGMERGNRMILGGPGGGPSSSTNAPFYRSAPSTVAGLVEETGETSGGAFEAGAEHLAGGVRTSHQRVGSRQVAGARTMVQTRAHASLPVVTPAMAPIRTTLGRL